MQLGLVLAIAGVALFVALFLLARLRPDTRASQQQITEPPIALDLPANDDAVLLVQSGGRLLYANDKARRWFGLQAEDALNLERLAQRTAPSDSFLSLCATAGQTNFTLENNLVEGISYIVPNGSTSNVLVSLRRPQLTAEGQNGGTSLALSVFADLGQTISASPNLDNTIRTILENVARLVPADFLEVALWDEQRERLTPYRLGGLDEGQHSLKVAFQTYADTLGYSNYLITERQPLLVADVAELVNQNSNSETDTVPFHSYLGIPLLAGDKLVGTLELATHEDKTFSQNDLAALRILSSQAGVALYNRVQQRQSETLTGLENMGQLGGLLDEPAAFYQQLIENVGEAVDAEILGFLVYDNTQKRLEGQVPFQGMPQQFVELYRTEITPGSPAQHIWDRRQLIHVDDARSHATFEQLGLSHLTQAAGLKETVLVPLISGDNMLGYLQAANKRNGGSFEAHDLRVLERIAEQAAPVIENANLIHESNRRAQRSESLRRIASLTSSGATLDEVLKYSLLEIVRFLQADEAAILLLDEKAEYLQLHRSSLISVSGYDTQPGKGLKTTKPDFENTATSRGESLLSADLNLDQEAFEVYAPYMGNFGALSSAIFMPLVNDGQAFGEIILGSYQTDFFTGGDIDSMASAVQQIARAMDRIMQQSAAIPVAMSRPSATTQKSLSEDKASTEDMQARAQRIRVGLDIAEIVNQQPDRSAVFSALSYQLQNKLDLQTVLIAEAAVGGPRLVHSLGISSEAGNPQAWLGQRNPLHFTLQSGKTLLVNDIEEDQDWQDNSLLKNLKANAFICLPIAANSHVEAAVLAVSREPLPTFEEEDQKIYDLIGNQVAFALQNLQLLGETRRRLREVNLLLDFSRQLGKQGPQDILRTLVESALRVLPTAHAALVFLWDSQEARLIPQAAAGYTDNDKLLQVSYGSDEALPGQTFQNGESIRIDELDFVEHYNISSDRLLLYREGSGGRVPVSSMLIPLQAGDTTLGVLTMDNFNTPAAFSEEDEALVRSLTQQTALSLENASFTSELEARVDRRTQALAREGQRTRTLLRISTELSASLDLEHVINRSLELLNEQTGAEQSTIVLYSEDEQQWQYRAGIGYTPSPPTGGREAQLKPGEGLAGWVIQERQSVVIKDLLEDERWKQLEEDKDNHRSAMAVPLIVGEEALGALLLFHREVNHFDEDQIDLIQAAANQFAVAINNAELFRLIRDQAEDLGSMLRNQQVEASRSIAMLAGVADGVLVTDRNGTISLFNEAAEEILALDSGEVVGKSLDDFLGLFGGAAQHWMETIKNWSETPGEQEEDEIYSEQVTLDDGRVVSVRLAQVSARDEFLGTVSIFRDVTHQVEVDRLKSEFVATVSHELRTPMTPIKGYIEFLLMGGAGDLNDKQMEFMQTIKHNTDRLSILVNDLLDVSRIEAGKIALSKQPLDMNEVAQLSIEQMLQQQYDGKKIEIGIEADDNLPLAYGDLERASQIMVNLLDNAYKYTPDGGRVKVRLKPAGVKVQVEVEDDGIGIFPEEQERIFERFFRGENPLVMSNAGTGLGLPIVRELVLMHNGEIWVDSSGVPGKGSTFTFTIPVYRSQRDSETEEE